MLTVLGVTATMNMFAFSYTAMVAPIARQGFGVPDAAVGLLAAAEPLGSLIGGLLLARRAPRTNPRILMLGGSAAFLVGLVMMPMASSYTLACAILVAGGLGLAMFGNMQTSLVLTAIPAAIRSRQMGLITVCMGVAPLGQMLIGGLAEWFGPRQAVTASALIGLASLGAIAIIGGRAAKPAASA
jgi:predicted MFS family arabinose efflux permease